MKVAAVLALALVAGACNDKRRTEPGSTPAASTAPTPTPAPAPAPTAAPSLPGTLWLIDHGSLVRIANGTRQTIGPNLFPTRVMLPDGWFVTISSKGDGSADGERLILVGTDGTTSPLGPAATQIRDPALVDGAIVVAMQVDGVTNLYRIDLETAKLTKLTDDAAGNFEPAALADGAFVFTSSRDGDAELYRRDRDGKVTRLTAFHKDDYTPTPSPDGTTIAFLSVREGPSKIFLVRADGTSLRRLTKTAGDESEPTWSPDGTRIAYHRADAGGSVIIVHDLATGAERILTPPKARDIEVTWSPDGTHVALTRDTDVVVVPVGGGDATHVSHGRLARWLP